LAYQGIVGESGSVLSNDWRIRTIQAIGLGTVLLGGILAGGAQRSGPIVGLILGVWNGVIAILLTQNPAEGQNTVWLLVWVLFHAGFGAIGGILGALIWRPIPETVVNPLLAAPKGPAAKQAPPLLAGKITWWRVVLACGVLVPCVIWADSGLHYLAENYKLDLSVKLNPEIAPLAWSLKAVMVLFIAAFGGASCANGLKQGMMVGFFSSCILVALFREPDPVKWLWTAVLTMLCLTALCIVGGLFGRQLFPPLLQSSETRKKISAD
jgi:hypothetical protein